MPRMNDTRRGELLRARLEEYDNAGLAEHRSAKFGKDMLARLARGKGFTTSQRKWVTSIIESGLPEPKDPALVERIDEGLAVDGISVRTQAVLNDFRIKAFNGWYLSERQQAFLENLLSEASEIAENGPWCPSDSEIEKIRLCVQLSNRYDSNYLYSHGGLSKAIAKATHFLDNGASAEAAVKFGFDEWCMERLFKQFKTRLFEVENPKHVAGEMRWAPARTERQANSWQRRYVTDWHYSMVVDSPVIDEKGRVAYPMIVGGELKNVPSEDIKKRRPKS